MLRIVICCLLLSLSAQAEDEWQDPYETVNPDPWETFNRKVFAFNDTADRYVLAPVARGYQAVTPDFVDQGVTNFFSNLGEVPSAINSVLQWKWKRAGRTTGRFFLNTTVGILGLFDVATKLGIEEHDEDFGQTLAVWGVDSGPYIVLPFLGPSTVRDGLSLAVDAQLDPLGYHEDVPERNTARGISLIDVRADLLQAEALITGDKYTFFRDAYLQRRASDIVDGEIVFDDFGDEDF